MGTPNRRPYGRRKKYFSRPEACPFCTDKEAKIDYKQAGALRRFISENGRIRPRRQTGACAKHQRAIAVAIKRARHLALLSYTGETLR